MAILYVVVVSLSHFHFHLKLVLFGHHQRQPGEKRDMTRRQGENNIVSVFGASSIPSDNHIRSLLDGVPAEAFGPLYEWVWSELVSEEQLDEYRVLGERLLVGIDGIRYFSSSKIHCEQCSHSEIGDTMRYHHQALTALVVHPWAA